MVRFWGVYTINNIYYGKILERGGRVGLGGAPVRFINSIYYGEILGVHTINSVYYGEILWGDGLGFVGSWVRGFVRWVGEDWAGLVCGFVGLWVALGFVWVSFPRATSEGFLFSTSTAGVELRDPRGYRASNRTIDSVSLR